MKDFHTLTVQGKVRRLRVLITAATVGFLVLGPPLWAKLT